MNLDNMTILGTHNNIDLVRLADGTELYYSPQANITAIGVKGLARLLDCDAKTVARAGVAIKLSKQVQMYTEQGLRMVTLFTDKEVPEVLEYLSHGRHDKKLRKAASNVLKKFAQAGFKLMVMLEAAPEQVAKEAINKINDKSIPLISKT